ncbi:MAG: hypothetical protein QOG66_805 [Methylobacteriaceae bacterium]|nr:hypothetical protein [Methylobacteriaceae bacterium]
MGERPVAAAGRKMRPNWKLGAPHDKRAQGLVVSGFADLPAAQALFLRCPDPAGLAGRKGAWLQTLNAVAPITDADGRDERSAAIAFTFTGLKALGVTEPTLASFSAPFREGMYQEDRLRRLGDRADGKWTETVVDGGPQWSGNTPVRRFVRDLDAAERVAAGRPEKEEQVQTPVTVHALLILYDKDPAGVSSWATAVEEEALARHGIEVVHRLALDLHLDPNGIGREHFGFADGISQPIPFDDNSGGLSDGNAVLVQGKVAKRDEQHGVPLGEILFGHVNGHHERAPGPMVPHDEKAAKQAHVPAEGVPEGFLNLGLDGSYLVVRELQQDVPAFWKSMEDGAVKISAGDPDAKDVTALWLAERVVGRSIDGHLLCPKGYLGVDEYDQPRNDFRFLHDDPQGHGCPPGSHVRRGNPRDGLASDAGSAQTLLDAANNHRILRRGRKYGPKADAAATDENAERGLLFMCLNTDIARQFEFVQQTWVLNSNFATLFDETDPLIGPKSTFTIREHPLRRIVEVDTFVKMAGGEYFFLPSIPATKYLAAL